MAQRIQTLCDEHATREVDTDGATWVITVQAPGEKAQAYEVDLCPECGKPLQAAIEHLGVIGRRVSAKARRAAPGAARAAQAAPSGTGPDGLACPKCPDLVLPSDNALRHHARQVHDTSVASLLDWPEERAPLACPECGDRFTIPQALGAHRRKSHGVQGAARPGG